MAPKEKPERPDSPEYLARRREHRRLMTICGRNPVLEALLRDDVQVVRLHVAEGSRGEGVDRILQLARQKGVDVRLVPAQRVAQISRNSRQDQGVAADVRTPSYGLAEDYLESPPPQFSLMALDNVTTPRNVGMAIRSATAGGMDGLILPEQGCCGIIPLVVKASAGTVFAARILRCETLAPVLERCALAGGGGLRPRPEGERRASSTTSRARARCTSLAARRRACPPPCAAWRQWRCASRWPPGWSPSTWPWRRRWWPIGG